MIKRSKLALRHQSLGIALASVLLAVSADALAAAPTAEDIIGTLAIEQKQVAKLEQGEIIAFEIGEATQKELAAGVAMYLPLPPSKLAAYFKSGDLASLDADITASGEIRANAGGEASKGFAFSPKQSDEAEDLLNVEEGDHFNLSVEEIRSFAPLKQQLANADKKTLNAGVSQHYREILLQRLQAYRKSGLDGIAPYARDGKAANPAAELRTATTSSKVLQRFFPNLYTAWLNYPAKLPSGTDERFYWLNRNVESRPTAILGHRILDASDAAAVIVARQFYVGHSYNSSQLLVGCLPYLDGSLVFYTQRTSTDQVAGMGSSLKHSIGREQMQGEMVTRLERMRSALRSF